MYKGDYLSPWHERATETGTGEGGKGKRAKLTSQLCNEQSQSNSDRCNERRLLLLSRQEQHRQTQLRGQKHLDETPLSRRRPARQAGLRPQWTREHTGHERSTDYARNELHGQQQQASDRRQCACQDHGEGDGRVEESTADAVEDPCRDGEGETKGEGDEEELVERWGGGRGDVVGDLGGGEGEEEEHDCADKLAGHGDEVALPCGHWAFAVVVVVAVFVVVVVGTSGWWVRIGGFVQLGARTFGWWVSIVRASTVGEDLVHPAVLNRNGMD